MRISLSALGLGEFQLSDGRRMEFPETLQLGFDFRGAMQDSTIIEILCDPHCDSEYLKTELEKLRIRLSAGSIPAQKP